MMIFRNFCKKATIIKMINEAFKLYNMIEFIIYELSRR